MKKKNPGADGAGGNAISADASQVHVEVLSRDAIRLHPQAMPLRCAILNYGHFHECAGGCEHGVTSSNSQYLAFMRRRAQWDSDTFALGLCPDCAALPDLRSALTRSLRAYFVANDLLDHHVTSMVLPPELGGAS